MTKLSFAERLDTDRFVLVHKDGTLLFPYMEQRSDGSGQYSFVAGTGHGGGKRAGQEIFVDTIEELVLLAVREGKPVCARPRDRSKGAVKYSLRTGASILGYGLAQELTHLVDGVDLRPWGTVESVAAVSRAGAATAAGASLERPEPDSSSKVTRISYNSAGWTHPTGEARRQEDDGTYNARMGFGHEDWLFRNEWLIEGWRYAFLQGVNKSHGKLVREGVPFDVTLFTVLPDKSRQYVAHMSDVECLSDDQATWRCRPFLPCWTSNCHGTLSMCGSGSTRHRPAGFAGRPGEETESLHVVRRSRRWPWRLEATAPTGQSDRIEPSACPDFVRASGGGPDRRDTGACSHAVLAGPAIGFRIPRGKHSVRG